MRFPILAAASVALMCGSLAACAEEEAKSPAPRVYFVNLHDGDMVTSPFKVVFGLENFGVAPAGVEKAKTGHHHLLIDTEFKDEDKGYPLPADEHHRHFGGGQTETVLDLPPGEHVLQLMLGDHNHVPFNPPIMSERITIRVE
ncbi:MAG: DUF4399 domain-containing protein [Rhodothalassiaceae bacterium]